MSKERKLPFFLVNDCPIKLLDMERMNSDKVPALPDSYRMESDKIDYINGLNASKLKGFLK